MDIYSCHLDDANKYEYTIMVDDEGNVIHASYGCDIGYHSAEYWQISFHKTVRTAMEGILTGDKDEFTRMKNKLNEKFRNIAENILYEKKFN